MPALPRDKELRSIGACWVTAQGLRPVTTRAAAAISSGGIAILQNARLGLVARMCAMRQT